MEDIHLSVSLDFSEQRYLVNTFYKNVSFVSLTSRRDTRWAVSELKYEELLFIWFTCNGVAKYLKGM